MSYIEIECKEALNKLHTERLPYPWDLNIYRGCSHGCKYCFAMYTHKYMDSQNYFNDIFVKTNIVEALEKKLSKNTWKREIINLGGVTDSYQQAEEEYRFMPQILRILIKYKTPCIISTKSNLILRDYDLIDELSKITYVNIACTITTIDEKIREKIEPNVAATLSRFNVLKEFKKTNASRGMHIMPIIPYLTDNYENLDLLYDLAKQAGVLYVLPSSLNLRGMTRQVFFNFIYREYPHLYEKMKYLFKTGSADIEYKNGLYKMINGLRDKYGLSSNYSLPIKEKIKSNENVQLSFFD